MTQFIGKLWQWILNRSPRNAATPDVQPIPPGSIPSPGVSDGGCPIETNVRTESIADLFFKLGSTQSASREPDGQLITTEDKLAQILGCGHVVTQLQAVDRPGEHIIGIAGPCEQCKADNQRLLLKGELSIFDAERLSLVCTDCGKSTPSGLLCHPKHCVEEVQPDGTRSYLPQEQSVQLERQRTAQMPLQFIAGLLGEEIPQPSQGRQEPKNDA
jgi:hypothetical protein